MFFPMIDFLRLLVRALTRLLRSRARLEAEILVLRRPLNVPRRKAPREQATKQPSSAFSRSSMRTGPVTISSAMR